MSVVNRVHHLVANENPECVNNNSIVTFPKLFNNLVNLFVGNFMHFDDYNGTGFYIIKNMMQKIADKISYKPNKEKKQERFQVNFIKYKQCNENKWEA